MAQDNNSSNLDTIGELSDMIAERVAQKSKKPEIPAVYKSGMRGNEVPPALRNKDTKDARKAGQGKGIDPEKVKKTQRGRIEVDEDGQPIKKKKVEFEASAQPKNKRIASLEKTVKELQATIAKLTKKPVVE